MKSRVLTLAVSAMVLAGGVASQVAQGAAVKVVLSGGLQQYAKAITVAYRKANSHTQLQTILMGSGTDFAQALEQKPDIYIGLFAEMGNYADVGIFQDMSKVVSPKDVSAFPKSFSDAFAVGKHLLGLPVAGAATCLYYNKDLFSKAGVAVPTAEWTWDNQYYIAARKLTRNPAGNGTNAVYGMSGMTCNQFGNQGMPNPNYLSMIYSYGGSIVNRAFTKPTFLEKPAMDAVNLLLKFHREKLADMTDYGYDQADPSDWPFWSGRTAMMPMLGNGGSKPSYMPTGWAAGKAPKIQIGVAAIPRGPKGAIASNMTQVACLLTTSKPSQKQAVSDFMKFIISDRGQQVIYDTVGGLPTTTNGFRLKKVADNVPSPILHSYTVGKAWSARKGYLDVEFTLWGNVLSMAKGDTTMAELTEAAKGQCQQAIDGSTYSF